MNVRVIPRAAVQGSLRLVRTPLDAAMSLLPANGTGALPTAQLAVDRADAAIRSVAGSLLGDPVLRDDGQRRREAAHDRARALRLRDRAEQTAEHADVRLQEREDQAREQRRGARQASSARRRQAETRAEKDKQQAAKIEGRRQKAARAIAARREEAIEERAPREQLKTLDAKDRALRAREKELNARDEAERLADAASQVKANRKAD